ncbi:MAG TPA: MerR family transcriptional regulator [Thermoanaerobaculia bacterium]|nr:MerR family transcriptional regulator [Thermoanaerobaculia bacterium]
MAETRHLTRHRSGEVARKAAVSTDTLAHYERRGLLRKPPRLANGYRSYPADAVDRVVLIKRALAVGFTLDELARLLRDRDAGRPPCHEVRALAERKLRDLEQRLLDLIRLRDALEAMLENWDLRLAQSVDGTPARLLESLASIPASDAYPLREVVRGHRRKRKDGK